jgi:Mn2+/Fe2+ NRAMP family transporter
MQTAPTDESPQKKEGSGGPVSPQAVELRDQQSASSLSALSRVDVFFRDLGPGLITGCADDDPSGISTYSIAGAAFGYATLWTALLSFPLMVGVQMMCSRLGMVTGRGLASVIRLNYPLGAVGRLHVAGDSKYR